jgi:hypothetical protein
MASRAERATGVLTVGEALEALDTAEVNEARAKEAVREARHQLRLAREHHQPGIGAVIKFSRGDYDYAAIRASNGSWYTTGSTCPRNGYTWAELIRVISTNPITLVLAQDFRRWD